MAKGKKKIPDISSNSTADIAFLSLIFFSITTSMNTDRGLARRLPPPPEQEQNNDDIRLKERSVLQASLNMNNQLMCGNDYITTDQLRTKVKESIASPYNSDSKPERYSKDIPFFGNMIITEKHVASLRCDRGSSHETYIAIQNELVAVYNELRDELAQEKWQKNYADLDEDQQKAIRNIYPRKISEAEPKRYEEKE